MGLVAGCTQAGLLAPAGEVAAQQWAHLSSILMWMLLVVVPLFIGLPVIILRYRLGRGGRYRPHWEFSWPLEVLIWGVPLVVVSVLSWNLWRETLALDPYDTVGSGEVLKIKAVAYDWKWLFLYPAQDVASADRLVLPEGRPVELRLTSATVLQGFSVPRLGGQIYAMPGMASRFNLRTGAPGNYEGLNTQYNGAHFAKQRFKAEVVTATAFDDWVQDSRTAPPLDAAAVEKLATPGVLDRPRTWGSIAADPFSIAAGTRQEPARPEDRRQDDG